MQKKDPRPLPCRNCRCSRKCRCGRRGGGGCFRCRRCWWWRAGSGTGAGKSQRSFGWSGRWARGPNRRAGLRDAGRGSRGWSWRHATWALCICLHLELIAGKQYEKLPSQELSRCMAPTMGLLDSAVAASPGLMPANSHLVAETSTFNPSGHRKPSRIWILVHFLEVCHTESSFGSNPKLNPGLPPPQAHSGFTQAGAAGFGKATWIAIL